MAKPPHCGRRGRRRRREPCADAEQSPEWRLPFQLTAAALAVLEAAGTALGIRLVAAKRASSLRALP